MLPSKSGVTVKSDDLVLVTGASGFIGSRVVETVLRHGFKNIRCFVRPSSDGGRLEAAVGACADRARVERVQGNLLSHEDCFSATKDAVLVYHIAAGTG